MGANSGPSFYGSFGWELTEVPGSLTRNKTIHQAQILA
jgi:hypothetical protein